MGCFGGSGLFFLDALINLFAMYSDVAGCPYPNAYLIAFYAQNGDCNFVAYLYRLANASGQNKHLQSSCYFTTTVSLRLGIIHIYSRVNSKVLSTIVALCNPELTPMSGM